MTHPITPPTELVQQWRHSWLPGYGEFVEYVATHAVQWGADQELEACIADIHTMYGKERADWLRSMRRPKPPSLKEQALEDLDELLRIARQAGVFNPPENIRHALEQLDD
jgi:hypothetical protein